MRLKATISTTINIIDRAVATYPVIIPAMANPVCVVFPTLLSFPNAKWPIIEPTNENNPAVIKIKEIEMAKDAMAKSLAFCSGFSYVVSFMI